MSYLHSLAFLCATTAAAPGFASLSFLGSEDLPAVLTSSELNAWFTRIDSWGRPEDPRRFSVSGNQRWFGRASERDYVAFIEAELLDRIAAHEPEMGFGHAERLLGELRVGEMHSAIDFEGRVGQEVSFEESMDIWSTGWRVIEQFEVDREDYQISHTYDDGIVLIQRGPKGQVDHQEVQRAASEYDASTGSWMVTQDIISRLLYALVTADAGGFELAVNPESGGVSLTLPVFDIAGAVEDYAAILPADAFWIPCNYQLSLTPCAEGVLYEGEFTARSSGSKIFTETVRFGEAGVPKVATQETYDPSRDGRILKRAYRVFRALGEGEEVDPLASLDADYPVLDFYYRNGMEFRVADGDVANQLSLALSGSASAIERCNGGRSSSADYSVDWTVHPISEGAVSEFTYPVDRLDAGVLMLPLEGGAGCDAFWSEPSCSCITTEVIELGDSKWLSIARSGAKDVLPELSIALGWNRGEQPEQSTLVMLAAIDDEGLADRFVPLPPRRSGEAVEVTLPVDSMLGSGLFTTPLSQLKVAVEGDLRIVEVELHEELQGVQRVLRARIAPKGPDVCGALDGRLWLEDLAGNERGDLMLTGTWLPEGVELESDSTLRFGQASDPVLKWSPWFAGALDQVELPDALRGATFEEEPGRWRFTPGDSLRSSGHLDWFGAQLRFQFL